MQPQHIKFVFMFIIFSSNGEPHMHAWVPVVIVTDWSKSQPPSHIL